MSAAVTRLHHDRPSISTEAPHLSGHACGVFVRGRTVTTWIIASYRTQFDRVIRAESYGSLRGRLQKKAAAAADAER
jgi:hypothetical protein